MWFAFEFPKASDYISINAYSLACKSSINIECLEPAVLKSLFTCKSFIWIDNEKIPD